MFVFKTSQIGDIASWVKIHGFQEKQTWLDRSGQSQSTRYSMFMPIPVDHQTWDLSADMFEQWESYILALKNRYTQNLSQIDVYQENALGELIIDQQIDLQINIQEQTQSKVAYLQLPRPWMISGVSYECGYPLQDLPLPQYTEHQSQLPMLWMIFYESAYIWDHFENTGYLMALDQASFDQIYRYFDNHQVEKTRDQGVILSAGDLSLLPCIDQEQYQKAFHHIQENIALGEVYQCNLTIPLQAKLSKGLSHLSVFLALRQNQQIPFTAYVQLSKDCSIMSFSPEHLIYWDQHQGVIKTSPIKGTRRLGNDEAENTALEEDLIASIKDRAEHLMIVDLERNDLGKLCVGGSIEVTELLKIYRFPSVIHLISTVQGRLRKNVGIADIFRAIFPGGSITGAPKKRSMTVIAQVENHHRSIYCGALGYLSFDEVGDFNLPIRTAWVENDTLFYRAGGGIVADSQADLEWQEIWVKCKGLIQGLDRIKGSVY